MKYGIFALDLQYIIPTKQQFILPPSFRWEDYFSANQAQELPMPTMFFVRSPEGCSPMYMLPAGCPYEEISSSKLQIIYEATNWKPSYSR
jgi:hypothetical protein